MSQSVKSNFDRGQKMPKIIKLIFQLASEVSSGMTSHGFEPRVAGCNLVFYCLMLQLASEASSGKTIHGLEPWTAGCNLVFYCLIFQLASEAS